MEECDDGNRITKVCAYGEEACEICDADCTLQAGESAFCGDSILHVDQNEECDHEDAGENEDIECDACRIVARLEEGDASGRIENFIGGVIFHEREIPLFEGERFLLMETEVTQALHEIVMRGNPSSIDDRPDSPHRG